MTCGHRLACVGERVQTIRPGRLRPGDTVGIVSPSWGGAGRFPHRAERGKATLEALGYRVKFAPHALNQRGFVSDTPENRVADLHAMFADPDVRAIVAATGGDHSCHLLPLLDFDLIRANPKIYTGYSDNTVLNVALWKETGLVTFNGPSLITEFAEYPEMFAYTRDYALRAFARDEPVGEIVASDWWTDETLEWTGQTDLTRPRDRRPSPGWAWLRPGDGVGHLLGGCFESLQHLRGTRWWPPLDAWEGAILFVETSEEGTDPKVVDGMLMDFANMGVLERVAGLLVGRPMNYGDDQRDLLRQVIVERTAGFGFPVVADMDFGHTAPMFTLPLGVRARIDGAARRFAIVEAAVS